MDLTIGTMTESLDVNGAKVKVGVDVVANTESMNIRPVITSVTVYPEHGNFGEIAKGLLAAADHPRQVLSVSHPKAGFIVPGHVFDRFEAARGNGAAPAAEPKATPAVPATLRRKPGRPRKETSIPSKEE